MNIIAGLSKQKRRDSVFDEKLEEFSRQLWEANGSRATSSQRGIERKGEDVEGKFSKSP